MDRKTSFVVYPADFLAAVHNFKKNQVYDLIISLCEFNLYGKLDKKLSEAVQERFDTLQDIINSNNARYAKICEKRKAIGSKGGSKRQANLKQTSSKKAIPPPPPSRKRIRKRIKEMNRIMFLSKIKIKKPKLWITRESAVFRAWKM